MIIELFYLGGCPNYRPFLFRLRELLARAEVADPVRLRRVDDDHAAQTERFLGSPTLRINGHDVDPRASDRRDYGMQCRVYATAEGFCGSPPDAWILAVLRRERPQHDARRTDQPDRRCSEPAERRAGGQNRVVPLPHGDGG